MHVGIRADDSPAPGDAAQVSTAATSRRRTSASGQPPSSAVSTRRRAAAAVARVLARPAAPPSARPSGGASSGSGAGVEVQVAAEVDEQQPVAAAVVAEEAEHERLRPEHRAVDTAAACCAEDRVLAAQAQQVRCSAYARRVRSRARAKSSLQRSKVVAVARGRQPVGAVRAGRGSGTAHRNSARPLRTSSAQLRLVVGEVEERRGRGELLPLEQHRRAGPSSSSAVSARSGRGSSSWWHAHAAAGVGDLVVVLEEVTNADGGRSNAGVPRRFFCQV